MNERSVLRMVTMAGAIAVGVSAGLGTAQARILGPVPIGTDTVLTDDIYGAAYFTANNVTLDCNHHQVHISSRSPTNCSPFSNPAKCGIVAAGMTGITIKNCVVVGAFDFGVDIEGSQSAVVMDTVVNGSVNGFNFAYNTELTAQRLNAGLIPQVGVTVSYDTLSYFEDIATGPTGANGILIYDANDTQFERATVSNAGDFGFTSYYNNNLVLSGLNVTNSLEGFVDNSSAGISPDSSVFQQNRLFGVVMGYDSFNVITNNLVENNNTAQSPGDCDAYQENANSNLWWQNQLATWCGTVPNSH